MKSITFLIALSVANAAYTAQPEKTKVCLVKDKSSCTRNEKKSKRIGHSIKNILGSMKRLTSLE